MHVLVRVEVIGTAVAQQVLEAIELCGVTPAQVVGSTARRAHRGRNWRQLMAKLPIAPTSVGTSRADRTGGSSPTTARCPPRPSCGTSSSHGTACSMAGPTANSDVDVMIPSVAPRRRWPETRRR
ncbi:MAG: hypothetical protein R2699_18445 [Acidimicrobiales bacterium]